MKFILWTLVWWGFNESMWWRIYKYRTEKYVEEAARAFLVMYIANWVLYFYLYNNFIK